ncbi:MAG: metal ABC transporter permease [Candidatus Margulisbacteria bacterium]|nr:metal ABC transporter permease [Candidatus Margulisiibacteriota bacterium]
MFDWLNYEFMKHALIAIILVTPMFALMGTLVVSNRLSFFSDVIGHSALTGIAIGVILGLANPTLSMLVLAVILAILINILKTKTKTSSDTVLGVIFAVIVATGVVILSLGAGFSKYTVYLIGDILSVTPHQLFEFAVVEIAVLVYWLFWGNKLFLLSFSPVIARSRGLKVFWIETSFAVLLAVVVTLSIRLFGILIINSLLILPAAAARNFAKNIKNYVFIATAISLLSGISGLITSYYLGSASGATVVLFCGGFYCLSLLISLRK